jgi:hypothetical protein
MKMLVSLVLLQSGSSPWESAVQQLQTAFTGTIAKGLSLVAIVVGVFSAKTPYDAMQPHDPACIHGVVHPKLEST